MKKYRDHYFNRAKQENYPARSVYKLQELHKRFSLLRKGAKVLDLGAAPGSWTLFAAKKVGPEGAVVAVDLQDTETGFPGNVAYFQADAFEPAGEFAAALESTAPFDLVMSDMAPKTTGVKFTDQCRSMDLALQALALARQYLIKGGHFTVKVFMGPDIQDLPAAMRPMFKTVKSFKPKSSRAESKEIFYVGLGFTGFEE